MPSLFITSPKRLVFSSNKLVIGTLCITLAIAGLAFCFFSLFLFNQPNCQYEIFSPLQQKWVSSQPNPNDSPTNVSHLVFGLVGSVGGWKRRKAYIESWWRPNVTRGYLFLEVPPSKDLLPWPSSSPPFRVSENNSKILEYTKHNATMIRIARGILETFREANEGVRWYIMGDDDSIFFTDNMVEVLSKYDHTKYIYIGGHSESVLPNFIHSFDMGFGGAGVIFSYPLVAALVPILDDCIKRYPFLIAADQMWQSCLADLGVYMTHEKGLHQIDLRNDISGLLSSHPQSPVLSLHHPEKVNPLFPAKDRHQSVAHLMTAARVDQSRLLQQTVCHHRKTNWSVSISWGYSAHMYESIFPKSILQKPLETFRPWVVRSRPPLFVFNTRVRKGDPCWDPHVFFLEKVKSGGGGDHVLTTYTRAAARGLNSTCALSGNHSADYISKIRVFSSTTKLTEANRRECCDIVLPRGEKKSKNIVEVKYRACVKDEVIA